MFGPETEIFAVKNKKDNSKMTYSIEINGSLQWCWQIEKSASSPLEAIQDELGRLECVYEEEKGIGEGTLCSYIDIYSTTIFINGTPVYLNQDNLEQDKLILRDGTDVSETWPSGEQHEGNLS